MISPTSPVVVLLLLLGAAGLLVLLAGQRRLWLQTAAGVLTVVVAASSGVVLVNDYYGYYRSWSAVGHDMFGGTDALPPAASESGDRAIVTPGTVERVQISGGASGISRAAFVYLPPQYFEPRFRFVRFPVIELLHGSPGRPSDWITALGATTIADEVIGRRGMGPIILVMPQINRSLNSYQDCTDVPGDLDDTYLSRDVPAWVRSHFRAAASGSQWGLLGYSSGGYCAANLALRHRGSFGAVMPLDGYYRPQDGPAARALGGSRRLLAANDPLATVRALRPGAAPLPAFWLAAGTGGGADLASARAMVGALARLSSATLVTEPGAVHNFYAWQRVLPRAYAWAWQQLAPPELKTQWPTVGAGINISLPRIGTRPPRRRHTAVAAPGTPAAGSPEPRATSVGTPAPITGSEPVR